MHRDEYGRFDETLGALHYPGPAKPPGDFLHHSKRGYRLFDRGNSRDWKVGMNIPRPLFLKGWKFQAANGCPDMLQRCAARITILRRIRHCADPHRIQNYHNHLHAQ